jgi:hypothetical protein
MTTWQEADYLKPANLALAELRADADGTIRREKRLTAQPVPVAVAVTEPAAPGAKGGPKPRIIVFGSDTFLQDGAPDVAGAEEFRQQFFSDSIDWLRERNVAGIPPRNLGMFALEKPIDWPSQVVLLAMVTIGITALGVGVWLSRRR